MTWLTLRLQRTELILLAVFTVAVAASLLATWSDSEQQSALYRNVYTLANCPVELSGVAPNQACAIEPSRLYEYVSGYLPALVVLPIIIAAMVALPTIVELASRTYRLAWTQSQTKATWAVSRLVFMVVIGSVVATALGLLLFWWARPLDIFWGSWIYNSYDLRGVIPIGNAAFALGLVLAIGTLVRQPIVTLALSTILYFVVRVPFGEIVRSHLYPTEIAMGGSPTVSYMDPSRWVLNAVLVDASGSQVFYEEMTALCPSSGPVMSFEQAQIQEQAYTECLAANGVMYRVEYHPESHYWPLQLIETGIFVAFGAVLIG